jgi:hypothetical protein
MWARRLRASGDAAAKECDAATSTAPRVAFCISGLARSFATPFMLDQHWQLLVRPLAPDASDRKADHGHRIFFHLKSDRSSLSASIPTILLALERGWSRSILGEAVVLNGSGAIAATTVGWRGGDANAFAAVVEANDTLLEALQPDASLCENQGATRHYLNKSFPRGAHMALGLSWCAAAIARHEAAHGRRFGLVAYARPDQLFAGPVTPWCRWPSATTALACHAPGSDGFWAAPRDLAAQIFGMAEAITQCQPGQPHLGSYECTRGPSQIIRYLPANCARPSRRRLRGRRLNLSPLSPACCGESNEALLARVLHRPTPVPIASNGGCDTLFPLISGRYVRLSGDAPCSVLPSKIWRGLFLGHVWPVQILAGSGFGPPRGLGRAPTPTWATRQAQEGAKQFRHIFLEAVGTPGNLTVGELDAAHGGPGSRPLTSWTEAREGQFFYGLAPRVYEPKIEAAAIHECRTALRPLDATWAPTWAARSLHGRYTDVGSSGTQRH